MDLNLAGEKQKQLKTHINKSFRLSGYTCVHIHVFTCKPPFWVIRHTLDLWVKRKKTPPSNAKIGIYKHFVLTDESILALHVQCIPKFGWNVGGAG